MMRAVDMPRLCPADGHARSYSSPVTVHAPLATTRPEPSVATTDCIEACFLNLFAESNGTTTFLHYTQDHTVVSAQWS